VRELAVKNYFQCTLLSTTSNHFLETSELMLVLAGGFATPGRLIVGNPTSYKKN